MKKVDSLKINNNLMEIADKFDTFIFDAYGVFWDGKNFYPNSCETMKALKNMGKNIYILSNGTHLSKDRVDFYEKKGISKGMHYDEFITSGEIARHFLLKQKLSFKNNKNPRKYFIFGTPNKALFAGTIYENVENPEAADFCYLSHPQLYKEQVASLPQYADFLFESKLPKEDEPRKWDSIVLDVFKPQLEKLLNLGLPVMNVNPDLTATEADKTNNIIHPVIRQGAVAEMYRNMGGEVVEMGKPHKYTFDFILAILKQNGININKERIVMIGDTVRTDILGGNNAGIKTILTTHTGIASKEILNGDKVSDAKLDALYKREKGRADFLIKAVGGIDIIKTR